PAEKIMCASYSAALSKKHSLDCRALIQSDWYQLLFPEVKLLDDQNTQTKFMTDKRGYRFATSVGGTATGEGGNFLIVDDPHSAEQGQSMIEREAALRWLDQTYSTRLNDIKSGVMIVIMQRLHYADLTGHLLEIGGWEHLKIPVESEERTVYSIGSFRKVYEEGELLHESRMGQDELDVKKRQLMAYGYAGQYMQNPSPTGGGEFKKEWIQFYKGKLTPSSMNTYIMVDPANSKKKTSDYTCIIVLGLAADKNFYVLDMVRDKLDIRERRETLFSLHAKYRPKYVLYEKYGMQVDADVMRVAMDDLNYRFTITEVGGALSKNDRITNLQPYFFEGRIWFPEQLIKTNYEGIVVDLVEEFIQEEYLAFPVGIHDDMMDALSRILDAPALIWPGDSSVDYHKLYSRVTL